ncbi:PGPGW domain-containing protein [Kineococcus radiotolerans]|uniref:Transmembrane protein (PGPGW) n=1 Tax=Kineococcus radiotolerans (strain ATCC BAA-149 / DSM 14245 / SRS30216) TaxID=266940 RepID=A6WBE4_KINRD|nr:PGPGW domain-containing protein [Kineococcus radiotolerans]ABS04133.1 hypothetical protein Krad_2661 [Kineococcus radiotolerans SRS30216 = ATCC BAA-149]
MPRGDVPLLLGDDDPLAFGADSLTMSIDALRPDNHTDDHVVDAHPRSGGSRVSSTRRAAAALRAGIAARPVLKQLYQFILAILGFATVAVGLILVPLPGPGWVVVFGGLSLLSTRFLWARRLRERLLLILQHVAHRYTRLSWLWRSALSLLGGLCSLAGVWACVAVLGIPAWVPQSWSPTLHTVPGW